MSHVWPLDVKQAYNDTSRDDIRPFKCLILMPFGGEFDKVAKLIKKTVSAKVEQISSYVFEKPIVERLDWVNSTNIIHEEIWERILEADLVFIDITEYNPNVMFEAGVSAAWKLIKQIVLIRAKTFRKKQPFNIAPIRYTEYELSSRYGKKRFIEQISQHTEKALIAFPDSQGDAPKIQYPLLLSFKDNRDDLRIYTPPFAHRRILDSCLEFGSRTNFSYSWASIGKDRLLNFELEFDARFSNPLNTNPKIGVGLRSQHYSPQLTHNISLRGDGLINLTAPNEESPRFYEDVVLRDPCHIDISSFHHFKLRFDEKALQIAIDDFEHKVEIAQMKKVFGPGVIRFQPVRSWMALKSLRLSAI